MINNNLYNLSFKNYLNYLKKSIFDQKWFKDACKQRKVKIKYLSEKILQNEENKYYLKFENNNLYFSKYFLYKFEYEILDNNKHLKLLNINIKNQTIFNVVSLIFFKQKLFLRTNSYLDCILINREDFTKEYSQKYNSYLDVSILSKILNNIEYLHENTIYKLHHLIPKKSFMYSIYVKEIINSNANIKSDLEISRILLDRYNIKLSRRNICTLRKKYLIPKVQKRDEFNFYLQNRDFYSEKKELNKINLKLLENHLAGIYELSSNKEKKHPFSRNNILYIGSSNNIKKRLLTYSSQNAHSTNLRNYLEINKEVYFRIIKTNEYKKFEMNFLNAFIFYNGCLPKLNKQRVLNI